MVRTFLLIGLLLPATVVLAQNKKEKQPDLAILPPAEQQKKFKLPDGFEVELVAVEPAVINPITMALDEKGRLYVSEGHTYRYGPKGSPVPNPTNPIVRLDKSEDGKGWKRVIVAEGFDDPVMGLLVRGGKMWCTSNDHIYVYDIDDAGKATNRKEILHDNVKAWNPFGFFVLEWGPDDMIYVSVGNHAMDIKGPNGEMKSRGNSGIVMRMKPDGSDMEKLVEGLRVPYSFEMDPFGQLWVISNGQGNPDRHLKVIPGVDYMCYSRPKAPQAWLAGKHPLAPPTLEIANGARTQLLIYYGANFPAEYQGRQFGVNWGPHGVGTRNHAIEQFVVDDRERVTKTDNWLTCDDPRFRPTQLLMDRDGTLLMADWYGRDDENDLTGRIWRVKYAGKDAPASRELEAIGPIDTKKALLALGSSSHLERDQAVRTLVNTRAINELAEIAAQNKNPIAAANALWALSRIGTGPALEGIWAGAANPDWKVRRLTLRLLKRHHVSDIHEVAEELAKDPDPAVRLEAVLSLPDAGALRAGLMEWLKTNGVSDPHLRYEAARRLAKIATPETFAELEKIDNADVRTALLIAIDLAQYENFDNKDLAKTALLNRLAEPGKFDLQHLLDLASLHADPAMIPALQKFLERPDLAPNTIAEASRLLRTLAGNNNNIKNPWVELVRSGKVPLTALEDKQTILKILPDEGPTPFGLKMVEKLLLDNDPKIFLPAAALARSWELHATELAPMVWKQLADPKLPLDARIELAATAAAIDPNNRDVKKWGELLKTAEPALAREIVRDFRRFPKESSFAEPLLERLPDLLKKDKSIKHDLALTLQILNAGYRPELGKALLEPKEYLDFGNLNFNPKPGPEQLALGRMAFERANCAKCHLLDANEKIGPTLGGVGRHELRHVIESILEPSKIILTGYEVERVEDENGVVRLGVVREKGKDLEIINAEKTERVPKAKVVERILVKTSIMPDGIEKWISRDEFADLLSFLMTQKANVGPPPKKK
jgi:putative membrane-bound dehydrogenase-like protein